MVNQEVFGGLISALSRGQSLQKAMFSLFNAGYKKEEIEEAARILQFQTPAQIAQKEAEMKKQQSEEKQKKPGKPSSKPIPLSETTKRFPAELLPKKEETTPEEKESSKEGTGKSEKEMKFFPPKNKNFVSSYGEEKNPQEFKKILDETIDSLKRLEYPVKVIKSDSSKPPIIIQRVSGYPEGKPPKSVSKITIFILIVLLILLFSGLGALFVFKDKLIEFFNNLNL